MYGIENYEAFVLAAIILNLTPGADTIYILTRSISQGQIAGIISALGIVSGAFIHIILAVLGLSTIIAKSIVIFSLIKWIGAFYLIYLGVQSIINKNNFNLSNQKKSKTTLLKLYRQGLFTNLFNPKVALFFLSLLPQFVKNTHINTPLPYLILGLTFVTTGTIWCLFIAITSSKISLLFQNKPLVTKWIHKISGGIFLGLGLQLLFTKKQ